MNSIWIIYIPQSGSAAIPGFFTSSGFPISFQCDRLHKLKSSPRATRQVRQSSDSVSPHGRLQKQIRRNYIQIVLLIEGSVRSQTPGTAFLFSIRRIHFFCFFFAVSPTYRFLYQFTIFSPQPVAEPSINLLSSVPDTPDRPFPESAVHWKTSADDMLRDTCNSPNPQKYSLCGRL